MIDDPINDFDNSEDDDTTFPCPCGDESCIGDGDDPHNIKLGATWYAAHCVMANHHPLVVEDRERDARRDERRDGR